MRVFWAIVIALAVHALIALALVVYVEFGIESETSVTLDLSSVELSFADEADETAPSSSAVERAPQPALPPETPRPAAEPDLPDELPPDPAAFKLPEPEVERPRMAVAEPAPDEPQAAPRQAKIDAPPRPKKAIRPEYPRLSRLRGEQGDVIVEIVVNERGTVDEVTVVASSGYSELDAAAVKAAKAAKFNPAKADGAAVRSTARLTLNFQLK